MLSSADKLASIGADFLICPENTIHQAFDYVKPLSPRPWLHIAEVVAAEAAERGYKRLGLTGTRWLVNTARCILKSSPRSTWSVFAQKQSSGTRQVG